MATHAGLVYAIEHPQIIRNWNSNSNSLVILSVPGELELFSFMYSFKDSGIDSSWFYEPDYNNELMSGAACLNAKQAKQLSRLPLLLKGIK